ncbi:alkaline shock response membrane anchor protein AmaP [Enterococcus malodoratus]|uniref:alkaline shock response membrane anchor protein AmaP n=1 Tax=Enterococcus malodoratus TaxID=71451 RepID=UPI003FD1C270
MNKVLKTILIIFSLVLLSIFLSVVAIYYFIASNPLDFSSLQQFVLTNDYAQLYLFWVAAALAILTVIGIFVILFYPKRVTKFVLQEDRGKLALDKRAIEGYVRTSIKQEDFMDNPKVNVTATKNKIRVNVRGQLKKTSGLVGQTDRWAKNVETKLRELLGPEEKVSIKVKLQSFEPTPTETTLTRTRPRVE